MIENVIQIKSVTTINIGAKKHDVCEESSTWNPSTCTCENGKYLKSIIDDSVITCDEIIEAKKTVPTKSASTNLYI